MNAVLELDPLIDQQLLLEILDTLHVAVYVSNSEGALCYANSTALRLDHLDPARDIGRKFSEIWAINAYDKSDSPTMETLEGKRTYTDENVEWYLEDGTRINAIISTHTFSRKGKLAGVFTLAEDVESLRGFLNKQGAFEKIQFWRLKHDTLKNGTKYFLEDIIGRSSVMKDTASFAHKLASKQMPVLIYGETGTGKEMYAQGIHNASSVAQGPFVAINCAAIPETLLESSLFGSVKGAFTGATEREGLFEKACGGTLFLDEINSMPVALQAKLLRVIQEKELQRLGGTKTIAINCRIISATNKMPQAAIEDGTMREDLYYRLSIGAIMLPPLRERSEDIEELVAFFIAKGNTDMDTAVTGVSDELLALFKSYRWPGNVRELFNTIANAIIMSSEGDKVLDVGHLPSYLLEAMREDQMYANKSVASAKERAQWKRIDQLPMEGNINEVVDAFEEMLLRSALETSRGKITKAADILGISRQSLYAKLKKYEIDKHITQ